MITSTFEWRRDEDIGRYGWILRGFPNFNALGGLGIAHDTLEHFADGDGSLTDEMLAFGSILRIRVESGWFNASGNFGPAEALALDFERFFLDVQSGSSYIRNPPRTYRLALHLENVIEIAARKAMKSFREGYLLQNDMTETIQRMTGWMRIGYRRAKRRFYDNHPHDIAYLFDSLKETVDKRYSSDDDGNVLTVKVNPVSLKFAINVKFDGEY